MFKHPAIVKLLTVGGIVLLLCAVLARIGDLVAERSGRQSEAIRSIQNAHAGAQTLLGPLFSRDCRERWSELRGEGATAATHTAQRDFTQTVPPEQLQADGQLAAEARYRGLFKVNTYAGQFKLSARWAGWPALPAPEHAGGQVQCEPGRLWLALGDARGIRQAQLSVNGQPLAVRPGTGQASYAQGLHGVLPAASGEAATPASHAAGAATVAGRTQANTAAGQDHPAAAPLEAVLTLHLVGTAQLALVPAAQQTAWALRSDWPHPSFGGRFLPTERQVSEGGFQARWAISALASNAAAAVQAGRPWCAAATALSTVEGYGDADSASTDARPDPERCLDTLAVGFIDPVNPYVLSDRATKYGLLFIALTFTAVALLELLGGVRRRVHPVQYGLVGLALALFFLLLLSLSEHLGFETAYALAASACVLLLGAYAAPMLGGWRAGAAFGAACALLYGLVFWLLQREQTALVIGSLGLFAALALVMWLTRRIDWYGLLATSNGSAASAPARPEPPAA